MKIPLPGITDPHIHIFNSTAYLYASHDFSPQNKGFDMRDWQVWSSTDLINWEHRSTLFPEQTYIGKSIRGCWATDALFHKDVYYWFFSEVHESLPRHQIGVVRSHNPNGPWEDFLGRPLVPNQPKPLTAYDPCLFKENNRIYLLFGVWNYYIVELRDDLSGFASRPVPLTIINPEGPYGKGKTDDKVSLHKRAKWYYLSWGCYYAVSHSLHGPYQCKGSFLSAENIALSMRTPTWPNGPTQGRHGNFFSWKSKDYFCYCDMSNSGNRYYRSWWLSEITFETEGSIRPMAIHPDGPQVPIQ